MADFNEISDSTRVPGVYIEIDGSQAGLGDDIPKVLLVGQKLAAGTAPAGEIVRISSVEDAVQKSGAGSMLSQMAKTYREGETAFELWMLPYSDNTAGVKATGTITVSHAATKAGTLALYIAARSVSVGIGATDTTTAIAAAIAAAINAAGADIPVTAAAEDAIVTLTAKHAGTCGNDIDIRLSLYDETVPAGLVLDISGMSDGAGDPATGDIRSIIGTRRFRYIALGINDAATLAAWHAESQYRYRAQPVGRGFRGFLAFRGDDDAAAEYGQTKNYEHFCCPAFGINPSTTWEVAAALCASAASGLWNNPVKSLEGRKLYGIVAKDDFNWTQQNALLYSGMSTLTVADDGSVYISRPISMYQKLPDGAADDAFLDINTAETMDRIRELTSTEGGKRFKGTVAARTSEGFGPTVRVTTEDSVKAFLLSLMRNRLIYALGWCQEYEFYKSTLTVAQDVKSPSRFNYWAQPVVNSPFYILAGRDTFLRALPLEWQT